MDQAYTCHDRNVVRWAESKEQHRPALVTKCGHVFWVHANEDNETTQWCNTCNHVIMIMRMGIPFRLLTQSSQSGDVQHVFLKHANEFPSQKQHMQMTYWKKMNTPRQSNRGTISQFLLSVATHPQSNMQMTWPESDACAWLNHAAPLRMSCKYD